MIKDKITLKAGTLLISPPVQSDINFRRTVVLLCEHSENGSFGLILNRSLALVMEQIFEDLPGYSEEIGWGGPVQPETLHFIHRIPDLINGGAEVHPGVYWGGDFEQVKSGIRSGEIDPNDIRFFLGYSGWSSGQLANEVEHGGWILANSDEDTVFDTAETVVWRQSLRQLGGTYAILANYPEYPTLN
jgi:putative transcriptional regulator